MGSKLPEFTVIKDTREQQGWEFSLEEKKPGNCQLTNFEIGKLDTGDYSIKGLEHLVTIERKNGFSELFGNLGSSVSRQRFEREMERMAAIPYSYILVETNLNYDTLGLGVPQSKFGMPASAILKYLMDYSVEYNVKTMFVGDCGKKVARSIFESICRKHLR